MTARRVVSDDEFGAAVGLLDNWFKNQPFIKYYLKSGGLGDGFLITGHMTGHIIKNDEGITKRNVTWNHWEPWYFDEVELKATLDAAYFGKDPLADKVARSLFYWGYHHKIDIPEALAEFTDYALSTSPIPAKTSKNLDIKMRNALIIDAIEWLKSNSNLEYTRNDANEPHSCCDAIVDTFRGENTSLSLTYEYIKKDVWAKWAGISFRPSILRGTLSP